MNDNLKSKAKRGLVWSSVERLGTQGVQFLFSIILARLLAPSDYGIVAMPMIFLMLAQVFIDSGFANALIRKIDLKEEDLCTAFYFNVLIGLFCYLLFFFLSPLIAEFYDTPELSLILKFTSLGVFFNSLCIVQQAILTRKIDFRSQAIVTVSASVVSGLLGIYLALIEYGVWALVVSQVLSYLIRVVLLWLYSSWRPKLIWSNTSFSYLWKFGSRLMLSGVLDCLYQNAYTMVIGKFYHKQDVGFYTRAMHFSQLPASNIYGILRRVTFPVLSKIQNDDLLLKNTFLRILKMSVFVVFPLMFFLVGISDSLIIVLLTEKWLPVSPLMKILCIALMWRPIDSLNLNILTIKGRTDLFLRLEIIKKFIGCVILALTLFDGLYVLCYGYLLYCILEIVFDTYYTGKIYDIGLITQIRSIIPTILLSLSMLLVIIFINNISSNSFINLAISIIVGPSFYFGIAWLMHFHELNELSKFLHK